MRISAFLCAISALILSLGPADAAAATRTVCASGCQYTDLQPAIDAAVFGDTILLRAGETFVGHYRLRVKSGTGWITIRSDASASLLPPAGVRLIPDGRSGANTSRAVLPRILGKGGALKTTPLLRTDPGAHGYRIQYIEFDGAANLGYETLMMFGDDTTAAVPYDLILDHVYMHGDPYRGQKRGITMNSAKTTIVDSFISDIKAVNADSQAIAIYNGPGPFTITNNHLEGAGENVLFGGADPAVTGLVPADAVFRGNLITKPLAWRNAILATPTGAKASAGSGGSLSSATHYFRVVAVMSTGTATVVSLPSTGVSAATSSSGKVTVSWSSVRGADRYRVYRGTTAGAETVYTETTATSLAYTGVGERAGTPPKSATKWVIKNLFEVKIGERITVDGNIFENIWPSGQFGYAIVLTPRNSGGDATWARVKDVVFTNNLVRNAAGVINIAAYDDTAPSGRTTNVTLRNNMFLGIDAAQWGGSAKVYLLQNGPTNVVIDHNTLIHTNTSIVYAAGPAASGFKYTQNVSRHGKYGIMGASSSVGLATIAKYFPTSTITCNVFAGGSASLYPTPNSFPTEAQFTASFVDYAGANYQLRPDGVIGALRCNSAVPGVNYATYIAAQRAATTGGTAAAEEDPPSPVPDPSPTTNVAPTAVAAGPYAATPATDLVVDGSGSRDADGTIAEYRWTWGDQALVRAADLSSSAIHGSEWTRVADATAAGGTAISNPDRGASKRSAAQAAPASYVEFRVPVAAGTPYYLWVRTRAASDSFSNDSLYVQFSGATDGSGAAVARIGSTDALAVVLEEGSEAGVSGWGWNDGDYGGLAAPLFFTSSGSQTIRIQQREDGILWDQIVLTSAANATTRPGAARDDRTLLSASYGTSAGVAPAHRYARAGVYPVTLSVTDNDGATASASTTATIGTASALAADGRGPYSGTQGAAVTVSGTATGVPSGTSAAYSWTFGDDIVLRASEFSVVGGSWSRVSDTSAAGGVAVSNPDRGASKPAAAAASPSSYVEATFRAAAGVPYRVWVRMRAASDSWSNDSVFVQFSGTTTSSGAAAWRIGTSNALPVILEERGGAGVSGWGWADTAYEAASQPVYFNQDGEQRIRIQQREDGVIIDQIVISANEYFDAAPGTLTADRTILPTVPADAQGATVSHIYPRAGVYPIVLKVTAGSATAEDRTTATIK